MSEVITDLITAGDAVRYDLRRLIGEMHAQLPGSAVFIIPFGRIAALCNMTERIREIVLDRMRDTPYYGAALPGATPPIPWSYELIVSDAKHSFMVYLRPETN